jgi:CRP/FNR family cyclic AMP-dependent transcriptional regulator
MSSHTDAPPAISFNLTALATKDETFARGDVIFSQGDRARTLMYIQRGRVKLAVRTEDEQNLIVAILGPGEFLGEACLGSQKARKRTATAIAPTALKVIERSEMTRALHDDREFSYCFLSYMLSRNIRLEEDLVDQVSRNAERRLARALLLLAGKGNQRELRRFAGITQGTLATMIGTTRSRVNFFMNKFRMLGFIDYDRSLDANGGMHINTSLLGKAFFR